MSRIAAIDIGTVTTRLLVADIDEQGIREVERSTDITHLGERVHETGALAEEAMQRVAQVIGRYSERVAALGVDQVRAIATSASRDAANGDRFLDLLAAKGVTPEIVSGDVEARLSFEGATYGMRGTRLLVVDIGGGSTELVLGDAARERDGVRIEKSRSIDIGSRRLTEMFLRRDPPSSAQLEQAQAYAAEELRRFFGRLEGRASAVVSVAGTATTLAAIQLGMAEYDAERVQGYELSGSDVADLLQRLATLPLAERRQVVGLDPGRAPVIVAGALILGVIVALSGLDSTLVSDRDILYGIVLDTFRRSREG